MVRTEPAPQRSPVNNTQWFTISGGDGFYTAQDPTNPDMVWGESQNAGIQQTNLKHRRARPRQQADVERALSRVGRFDRDRARRSAQAGDARRCSTRIDALRAQQKKDSADLQIRYNWESPYFLSPHNPQVFYLGGSRVSEVDEARRGSLSRSRRISR